MSLTSSVLPSTVVSSALPSNTQTCSQYLDSIPDGRPACAILNGANATAAFDDLTFCCKGQPVVEYSSNCSVYCLAQEQTVGELTACIGLQMKSGGILCNGEADAIGNESTNNPGTTSSGVGVPGAVVHTGVSKGAVVLLGLLFFGSGVGMFL
ncbi:hypothetical protein BU16DRAFT_536347 [Lophium mytilinum]|uniref:Uncharacterized protein n=1 Tax=Lophium mytilinum TaxID=390894 RepID=A0A6A6R0K2_9PEZI|nr:hypothetical protein BU16DRAFT_536347 [Lophium mytilinum]